MKRRDLLLQLSGTLLATRLAHAQAFPGRPVTIVVPYPAGGSADLVARLVAQQMTASTGQPVVVENRGGANGNIGAAYVARSPADGYRLLLATAPMLSINPFLYKDAGVDMNKDLAPVSLVANAVVGIAVHPSLPVDTLAELIAYGRKQPAGLNFGTSGAGSAQHVAGLMLGRKAGVPMTHVAYKGGGPMINDLLAGHLKVGIATVSLIAPHVPDGKLKLLAIGEKARFPALPDVPTISESVPGVELTAWFGFLAPAGTPADVVHFLDTHIARALNQSDVKAQLTRATMTVRAQGPEALARQIREDQDLYGRVIRENRITAG